MVKDCKTVWENCLRTIQKNVSEQSYNTWFAPIVPLSLNQDVLTIQVPTQFFYEWLEEHYVGLLREVIDQELGAEGQLQYSVIVDRGNNGSNPFTVNLPNNKNKNTGKHDENGYDSPFTLRGINPNFRDSQLNPNYSFDNYVEGDCNRLARSAGFAVAKKPGTTSFNPLMIYGGVGFGKTHLIQAIGNHVRNNFKDKFVLYVSSEKFINQFIDAVKNNKIQDFQNFYLQVDALIIDDVQFFGGKEKTQEIFFHIFNHLHQNGKQIIMTSDRPPIELKGLEERLLSRFKWGLTADLQAPDLETRMAIIHKKMQSDGIFIPDNVVEYLAYSVDTHLRDLEGVLVSLVAHASLLRREIDLELAKQTIKNIVHDIETDVSIDFIQKVVAEYFNLTVDDLKAKVRKKEIVIARQVSMYFSKNYTNHSLKSIGYHFGGRDHSTVIHAVHSVEDMMDYDSKFRSQVEALQKKLKVRVGSAK